MNRIYCDSHLHLQDEAFLSDCAEVINVAWSVGVSYLVVNSTHESDWVRVAALARIHRSILPCYGLHPWFVAERSESWLSDLESRLINEPSGVGEIGLDRCREGYDSKAQEEVFRAQLGLARHLNRPVTIHCLKAWGWLMNVLETEAMPEAGIILHAYGGPPDLIQPLIKMGAWFSFAGNCLTSEKSRACKSVKQVPSSRLLIETDSPDLPPCLLGLRVKKNGNVRNEPGILPYILGGIAELRGESAEELADQLFANSMAVWGPLFALRQNNHE